MLANGRRPTSWLDVMLGTDRLQVGHILLELWDLGVDRGTEGGSKVGGTEGQVTKPVAVGERDLLLHQFDALER